MKFKYPRTPHVNWSNPSSDDKISDNIDELLSKEVVISEKLDGENTTMYRDGVHARSLDSKNHPSRNWVKNLQAQIGYNIPEGFRICGENLFAKHSIHYTNLTSYFYVFGVYDQNNVCLFWDEVKEWANLLGLQTVPELGRGFFTREALEKLWTGESALGGPSEGYVIRAAAAFHYNEHWKNTAKFVRNNHVTTSEHWMQQEIVKNILVQNDLEE